MGDNNYTEIHVHHEKQVRDASTPLLIQRSSLPSRVNIHRATKDFF